MSASPPASANKRPASPLSPDTAQASTKRVKEDPEAEKKEQEQSAVAVNGNGTANGNGVASPAAAASGPAASGDSAQTKEGGSKMEDDRVEG